MINSHKELVEEVKIFCNKMELINVFKYIKDVEQLSQEVDKSVARVFLLGLEGMNLDDENYNNTLTYKFIIADETMYDDDSIINSETENIFCISALSDFLKSVEESPIDFNGLSMTTESNAEKTFTTISGSFDFVIKRNPSYWKQMEQFNA